MSVNEYPLDFSTVYKGQVFTVEQLEQITGISLDRDYDTYKCRVLGVQAAIHHRTGFTAKFENDLLRVLTDAEASVYNRRRIDISVHHIHARNELLRNVDPSNLNPEQRAGHDRNLLIAGSISQAIKNAKRKFIIGNTKKIKEIAS